MGVGLDQVFGNFLVVSFSALGMGLELGGTLRSVSTPIIQCFYDCEFLCFGEFIQFAALILWGGFTAVVMGNWQETEKLCSFYLTNWHCRKALEDINLIWIFFIQTKHCIDSLNVLNGCKLINYCGSESTKTGFL